MARQQWIQKATNKMQKAGTVGVFGPATNKKIASGKTAGGTAERRAIFAQNMKKIAAKRKLKQ